MSLQLKILTPTGPVVECNVQSISASGLEGEFGVLSGHLPFLTALKIGPATFLEEEAHESRHFALGAGYAEVFGEQVTLFVETAEESSEIDVERAQRALNRSKEGLDNLPSLPITHPDYLRVHQAQQRALNRIHVASLTN